MVRSTKESSAIDLSRYLAPGSTYDHDLLLALGSGGVSADLALEPLSEAPKLLHGSRSHLLDGGHRCDGLVFVDTVCCGMFRR